MNTSYSSFENTSYEEDFDLQHITNFGGNISPPPPPKTNNHNKVLRVLLNFLNTNIITYNANLNKYKDLAVFLEREITLAHTELVSTYVKTIKFLARLISLDMQNSVSSDYSSLLVYFKKLFELHAFNLFSKIQQIQEYVIRVEETLKVSGWLLIRGIWMVNHAVSLQDRQQHYNFSVFVLAISRENQYIYGVCQKIMKSFENIYWLYEYLRMMEKNKNKIWDLDTFLITRILDGSGGGDW